MIYDKYKAKIEKLGKALKVVKRFRILILSILMAAVAIAAILLSTNGMVYSDNHCPTSIVYGQKLDFTAEAFMSSVSYEYCVGDTNDWKETPPTDPGTYKVRAVAKGVFGNVQYGKEHTFVITAKIINVFVRESELRYGDYPSVRGEILAGDTISCDKYDYSGLNSDQVRITPVKDFVRVYNSNGKDITHCYAVAPQTSNITLTTRPITITTASIEHVYDGTAVTGETFETNEGGLAGGDTVTAVFSGGSVCNAGDFMENTAEFSIKNREGIDVTSYYTITVETGTLSVFEYITTLGSS